MIIVAMHASAAIRAAITIFFVPVYIAAVLLYFFAEIMYIKSGYITITKSGEYYITR